MKKKILLSVFALMFGVNAFAQDGMSKKPNIIFMMTDDQRWDMFGCYGRKDVMTPNIDKLAEQSVVFDNASYAVAICMPSRATMFTGRYFSDHRVGFTYPYNLTLSKASFEQSYPAILKKAGYRTGFVGKFGVPVTDEAYHTGKRIKDYSLQEHLGPYFDFFAGEGVHFDGKLSWWPEDERLKQIYQKRPSQERTIAKGDAMIRFLETQQDGQPFCLSVSFDAVKNNRDSQMYTPHVEMFKGKPMWTPENYVEGKNTKLPKVLDLWRGVKLHRPNTSKPDGQQNVTRRFAVQGYTVDVQVGRLMAKLEEMGILDNTIVIYTSDNGRFQGSHGLYGKSVLYDEALKAPLIVFDGRVTKGQRGRRENALVSSVDFAPTMLSMAGVDVPDSMPGKDLVNVLNGTQDMSQWRSSVLIESLFLQEIHDATSNKKNPIKSEDIPALNEEIIAGNRSYRSRGVRTDRFKYFSYYEHDPVIEELYDMQADPHEQNNLAAHPEYQQVLEKMRNQTEELYEQVVGKQSAMKLKLK